MPDLLYEIGVEELPAGYLRPALKQLQELAVKELDAAELTYGEVYSTGTPRRMVLVVRELAERQPDAEEEVLGPPAKVAFDDEGKPTKAAQGFARSQGVELSAVQLKQTPRGEYCVAHKRRTGRRATEILAEILPRITARISFPKSMLWPGSEHPFARPVRSLTPLLGTEVVEFTLFGVESGRAAAGHPIMAPGSLPLASADFEAYRELLRGNCVMVDMAEREAYIRARIKRALTEFGGELTEEALLAEVTNLAQYPSVTVGGFDGDFLAVPAAVIEAAMMEHQRYFPVRDGEGNLRPNFIVVSDRGPEPSDAVRVGNEQVLLARLADARFFYQVDRKQSLAGYTDRLDGVRFLKGLGTYRDKCGRLEELVAHVTDALGLDGETAAHARRAACLCKADLVTAMVGEFPKLQGEVGRIYALNDGEPEPVATAIFEHYLPHSAGGVLPATPTGRTLGLAEKLDNLAACFALGLIPSGSADPYALRRQSHAALRMIAESGRHFDLTSLLRAALALLPAPHCRSEEAIPKLLDFLKDRLFQMALERGAPHDLIHAAMAPGFADVTDFWLRLDTLRILAEDECWPGLVASVERTHNISKDVPPGVRPDAALYCEDPETKLGAIFETNRGEIEQLVGARRYEQASRRFAAVFNEPVHDFFDKVFVNVADEKVRNNRLALLREINCLYSARVADLSRIVTGVQK